MVIVLSSYLHKCIQLLYQPSPRHAKLDSSVLLSSVATTRVQSMPLLFTSYFIELMFVASEILGPEETSRR